MRMKIRAKEGTKEGYYQKEMPDFVDFEDQDLPKTKKGILDKLFGEK